MDEEYLKMVLALPDEFFEGWEWKDGDSFIRLYDGHIGYIGNYKIDELSVQFTWGSTWAGCLEDIRPIPSQEQLQKMCINFHITHNKMSEKRAILHIIGHWANVLKTKHDFEYQKVEDELDYEYFGDPESFETLVMKFTVSTILMLSWDGEAWVSANKRTIN